MRDVPTAVGVAAALALIVCTAVALKYYSASALALEVPVKAEPTPAVPAPVPAAEPAPALSAPVLAPTAIADNAPQLASAQFVLMDAAGSAKLEHTHDFVGTLCVHDFLPTAMKRADRSAAAAALDVRALSADDTEAAWEYWREQLLVLGPDAPLVLLSGPKACRELSREALRATLLKPAASFMVEKQLGAPSHIVVKLALFIALESERRDDRHYLWVDAPALSATQSGAPLLAFAMHAAALGRERVRVWTGPFKPAANRGGDVEPRLSQALAAANFTRANTPAVRVYRSCA